MKLFTFAGRNLKEIIRDPLTSAFSLGFPVILLLLLSAIQANIPVPLFEIERLAPGIAVFGLSFMSLFSATLIARDRESAFLRRLYTTPLRAWDFIGGYTLPMLLLSVCQCVICFALSFALGLTPTLYVLYAVLFIIPVSLLFIGIGLLFGSILTVKQAGGICGALMTNLTAFLSGVWFDLELIGGTFKKVAYALPFAHAVELERKLVAGDISAILPNLAVVLAYAAAVINLACLLFLRQMKKN